MHTRVTPAAGVAVAADGTAGIATHVMVHSVDCNCAYASRAAAAGVSKNCQPKGNDNGLTQQLHLTSYILSRPVLPVLGLVLAGACGCCP